MGTTQPPREGFCACSEVLQSCTTGCKQQSELWSASRQKKKKRQRNPHLFFLPRGVWDLTSSVCFVPTGNGMTALQHQLLAFADLLGLYCYLDALFFLWLRVSLYQHAEL